MIKKFLTLMMLCFLCLVIDLQCYASNEDVEKSILTKEYKNKYIENNKIDVYSFKKENKNLDKALKKLKKTKKVAVKEKGEIGIGSYWTKTSKETDVYYVGKMKDGKPNGKGILYKRIPNIRIGLSSSLDDLFYVKMYEGDFKKGKVEGYGREYVLPEEELKVDGKNTGILPLMFYEEITDDVETNLIKTANPISYEGYFKNNKYSGKGNRYEYMIFDVYEYLQNVQDEIDDTIEESAKDLYTRREEGIDYNEYILENSSNEILKEEVLADLSSTEIRLAINEIYARHGRIFNDDELQDYFNSKTWYFAEVLPEEFDENCLNEIEKENLKILSEYQDKIKVREEVQDDDKEQESELSASNQINVYKGKFKSGKENGECTIYYQGKLLYKGTLKKGQIEGKGTLYYPGTEQIKYEGKWKDGQYHGKGTMYNENGVQIYKGEWEKGDYKD